MALPISYNSFTGIDEQGSGGQMRPLVVHHVPTDPRFVVRIGNAQPHTLVAHLPTLGRILF